MFCCNSQAVEQRPLTVNSQHITTKDVIARSEATKQSDSEVATLLSVARNDLPTLRHCEAEPKQSRNDNISVKCSWDSIMEHGRRLSENGNWEFNFRYNPALCSQVLRQGGLDHNVWFNQWCSAPLKSLPKKTVSREPITVNRNITTKNQDVIVRSEATKQSNPEIATFFAVARNDIPTLCLCEAEPKQSRNDRIRIESSWSAIAGYGKRLTVNIGGKNE